MQSELKLGIRKKVIKLLHWEYWPMWVVYFPVSFYYAFLALKARSFFFFSASNPSIETGGMFFESKWKITQMLPVELSPKTIFVKQGESMEYLINAVKEADLSFPLIAKPDRGGRGFGVMKVNSINELVNYQGRNKIDFMIQEYIDYPVELSVFYYRYPGSAKGEITSVTYKELLNVTGDGKSTIRELIEKKDRALLQSEVLFKKMGASLYEVLPAGQSRILVPYGNHCRGAKFEDYGNIVDDKLTDVFDELSKRIPGFYFGRYDLKCRSIDLLKEGKDFSILELNGAGSEPAHIYHPGFPFFKAQAVIFKHFRLLFEISFINRKRGVEYMKYSEFVKLRREEKNYKSRIVAA